MYLYPSPALEQSTLVVTNGLAVVATEVVHINIFIYTHVRAITSCCSARPVHKEQSFPDLMQWCASRQPVVEKVQQLPQWPWVSVSVSVRVRIMVKC